MDVRAALKEQYHAALAMLANCIERCPDDFWTEPERQDKWGDHPIYRANWRIAFHAAFFTHLYLGQSEDAFQPWPERPEGWFDGMWAKPWQLEPFELPRETVPATRPEMLAYIGYIDSIVDATVDGLDLASESTGIPWYKNMTKLSHQLLNLRHIQGHVGQLSELLLARGIDTDWISRVRPPAAGQEA